jgi:hypothetical protein
MKNSIRTAGVSTWTTVPRKGISDQAPRSGASSTKLQTAFKFEPFILSCDGVIIDGLRLVIGFIGLLNNS